MDFISNQGKKSEIKIDSNLYRRHAIKTRFITVGESYLDIFKEYVSPLYKKGDIISCSEKVISLCQNRIIKRDDIEISFFAKTLAKFASKPETGVGVGESIKMQYAINKVGLPKVIFASVMSGATKLLGKKGVFYKIVGQEVAGLDGFYGKVWKEYENIGIELPVNPDEVCDEIKKELGISCMIVDANDLGVEILGKSKDICYDNKYLKRLIIDNPAGQDKELTPFILIRKEE